MKKQFWLILLLFTTQIGISSTLIDFKVGDLVVFKKTSDLFIGKITDINNNNAVIEYIDPISPDKLKEYIAEISTLIKVKVINEKNDLELKMMVFFKNNISGKLYEGYVAKITETTALIEYTEPSEPNINKKQETEFGQIFIDAKTTHKEIVEEPKKEEKPIVTQEIVSDFKIGDLVRFKKLSSKTNYEGKIVGIKQNIAYIEYIDAADSKTKKIEKDFNELTKVKTEFKKGDFVKFKNLLGNELEGKITVIKQNIAEVEFIDPKEPSITATIEKNLNELTKIEKLSTTNVETPSPVINKKRTKTIDSTNKAKSYLKHTVAVNGLQFAFHRASIWYEYKFKELIGLRIPIYIDWDAPNGSYYSRFIFSIGINPKFYFNRHKIIKGFAGVEVIAGINPTKYKNLGENFYYMDFLGDVGISINPINHLNITVNCGAGINIDLGQHINTKAQFSYYPEISIGYDF